MVRALVFPAHWRPWLAGGVLLAVTLACPAALADLAIYTDALQNNWANWSWGATVNLANTSPVHSGSRSISVTITGGGQALYLEHTAFNPSPCGSLTFWLNGGPSGGQKLDVVGHAGGAAQASVSLPPLPTNAWQQVNVSLAALGLANRADVDGFWLQDCLGQAQPVFFVDDLSLTTPPAVALSSPSDGTACLAPGTFSLAASVTTNGHLITSVQFYNGTTLLNQAASPPYAFTWRNVGLGIYSVTARVLYDGGSTVDSAPANLVVATNAPATIMLDAQANRRPISPLIYGVAFAPTSAQLSDLNCPLQRSGGNSETRYNWQLNAHNLAADWYFESTDDGSATPAASADTFVSTSKNGGAQPMLTIPMIGWAPKLGSGRSKLASYSIAKYGPQTGSDASWFPDAGNGISSTNGDKPITWNDPNDANFATNTAFQQAFLQHLTNRWGLSTNGGVRYYLMDNEHSIWHSTHQDVHPVGARMSEIRTNIFNYAGLVKALDPNALVLAPEEWGWGGYFYSGYDQQWSAAHNDYNPAQYPDRCANGGWDYMPWLLNQLYQRATNTNQRLLDYFTLHCYPQGGESGDDVSPSTQLLRNRSTRQLWDTNYVDASWIGQQPPPNNILRLIPRMRNWVASYYPGTKIGITEYNWGAEAAINGATAQADILGIFGREGLDLATRWTTPDPSTPTYKALKMYRNYDGSNSTFGDTSVKVTVPNPDAVAAFAAVRAADGALTVMAINKQLTAIVPLSLTLASFLPGNTVQAWQLTVANTITRLPDLSLAGATLSNSLPPQSITLLVVPAAAPARLRLGGLPSGATLDLWLDAQAGQRYVLQASADLANWAPVLTNSLTASSLHLPPLPTTNAAARFYRAVWAP